MVEPRVLNYEDFCKESKCFHYNLINSLESRSKTPEIERDLETAKVYCKQKCLKTRHEFDQWLKEKQIRQWLTQRD